MHFKDRGVSHTLPSQSDNQEGATNWRAEGRQLGTWESRGSVVKNGFELY